MYYIFENQDRTKTVVLTFLRSELLNDLDGYGFVEGDVMNTGDPKVEAHEHLRHGRHQTQDITQICPEFCKIANSVGIQQVDPVVRYEIQ